MNLTGSRVVVSFSGLGKWDGQGWGSGTVRAQLICLPLSNFLTSKELISLALYCPRRYQHFVL